MHRSVRPFVHIRPTWRTILLVSALSATVLLLTLVRRAQSARQLGVNDLAALQDATASPPEPAPFDPPPAPEGYVWTVNEELVPQNSIDPMQTDDLNALTTAGTGGRYYVTAANHSSSGALSACAAGFHMASLWEILDTSSLTYAFDHPQAKIFADAGTGPPANWYGRTRTGGAAGSSAIAGIGNCLAWTDDSAAASGTYARLTDNWASPPGEIGGIWDVAAFGCNLPGPVWCVED